MKRRSWLPIAPVLCLMVQVSGARQSSPPQADGKATQLGQGVHLLVDDFLVASSTGVQRKILQPQRFLTDPVVTGKAEHQNWQPFLTVVHDPSRTNQKPFRMWYNVDVFDDPADGNFYGATGYLESADGIRWPGPYKRLESLADDGRVRLGASVLDEGAGHPVPAERFKIMHFDAGKFAGPRVAFSGDGMAWTMHDGGKPVLPAKNGDDIWTVAVDPLRKRYFLIGKTYGSQTWTNAEGRAVTANVRTYFTSTSSDFRTWSEPRRAFTPDERDSGITQWYGAAGFLTRGGLILGFLRTLRDDLSAEGVPAEAIAANTKGSAGLGGAGEGMGSGMGYTVLTWTRDGQTWQRDRHDDKFFEPDPKPGSWDHSMSWVGSAVEVGDEVFLYYGGYRWGHKYRHSVDRQLGLVKARRDRFVARAAGEQGGTLHTPVVTLAAESLALNVDAAAGEVKVQVSDASGRPVPGFRYEDCRPIRADSLAAPVAWTEPLSKLRGQKLRLEFSIRNARLFALEGR